ncbi:Cadherin cytoplasmic C-terminal [Mactra antiquata]
MAQDATVVYRLMEESSSKHYIGSVAIDSQLFNEISYEEFQNVQFQIIKEQNNYAAYFQIDSDTGLLWTNKVIDREEFSDCFQECMMDFNVAVYEMLELTKIIKVKINIEDVNDNFPEFLPIDNPIKVLESVDINSVIVSGAAIDLDKSETNSVQTYILLPEMDPPVFRVVITETKEFELVNNVKLDRETLSEYHLIIQAVDGGVVPLTGTTTIHIKVTDANDNAPLFTADSYIVSVNENIATNTIILNLSASDPDQDINGKIMYTFSNRVSDKIFKLFYINPNSGELSVTGKLDYETDESFNIQVVAYDLGETSLSSTTNVFVDIVDVNDNPPSINLHQPPGGTTLLESVKIGTFIAHVEVFDRDSGDNGQVLCTIPDSSFKLEEFGIVGNYKIVLNKSLDYETKPQYNVTFICKDKGDIPNQTIASFLLYVEDVNDNAPVFTKGIYSVSITENNEIDIPLTQVFAFDIDSGNNGQISYALHNDSSNGLFAIDKESGVITVKESLDREILGDQYMLLILAIDGGEDAKTSTGTVMVNIEDLNDNDPGFDVSPMRFFVSENLPAGTEVGNISVFDPDKGENGTVQILFPVTEEISENFVFEESGKIFTRKVLDREYIAVYEFYTFAVDMGGRTSSAEVKICVTDINDNRPEVIYPNEYDNVINVPVTLSADSIVLQIETRDYDAGDNARLNFTIRNDNSSGVFTLDHDSGEMYLNNSVEDNIGAWYTLDVDITDSGNPPLNTSVEINFHIVPAINKYEALKAGMTVNLWIVLGIVILTVVLSTTMIVIILKTCWKDRRSRRKGNCLSDGTSGSDKSDDRFLDSLSSNSNAISDPEEIVKDKDLYLELKIDDKMKSYSSSLNETGYMTYSSSTSVFDHMDTEQPNLLRSNGHQTIPCNGLGEVKQQDGCVQIKNDGHLKATIASTVSELFDDPGDNDKETIAEDVTDNDSVFYPTLNRSNHNHSSNIENTPEKMFNSSPIFTINHKKMAARKELCKIYKIQKKVMFSDDLECDLEDDLSRSLPAHSNTNKLFNEVKLNRMNSVDILSKPMYSDKVHATTDQPEPINYWNNNLDHFSRTQSSSTSGTDTIVNWPISYQEVDV